MTCLIGLPFGQRQQHRSFLPAEDPTWDHKTKMSVFGASTTPEGISVIRRTLLGMTGLRGI